MNDGDTVEPDIDESIRRQFESSWSEGNPQPIESVIGEPGSDNYLATLEELVLIELEFRWQDAADDNPARLEEYLERFSDLEEPGILTRLVHQEVQLRLAAGQTPSAEEYADRFPDIEVDVPVPDEAALDTGVEDQADFDTSQQMATIRASSAAESGGSRNSATIQGVERPQKPVVLEGDAIPGYDLLGELGRGGMGVVYKARDQKLKRVVALKMILGGGHASDDDTLRFQTEAEAVAKLQHPNIVQIYEVGEHDGRPYISLEYADGGNLDSKIAGTPQNPTDSAELIESLARAIHLAHQQDIIHRDLKPANILISAEGEPKITDFGLAKKMDDDSQQTKSGAVMGTPSYMPPEQASSSNDTLGPTADVYALGAILYHMLTGRPPFHAETQLDTLMQVIGEEPLAPRKLNTAIPVDLETICLKCLEKDIPRRYESAEALAEDLHRFQAGKPIEARPVSMVVRGWKWTRRRPAIAGLVGVSLAATVAIIALTVINNRSLKKREQQALRAEYVAQQLKYRAELNESEAKVAKKEADASRAVAEEREAEALQAQKQAREAEASAKQLLARTHVENGARLLQEGDTSGALEWFVRAQSIDQFSEIENRISLMRTWNTLQQTPKPVSEKTIDAVVDKAAIGAFASGAPREYARTFSVKRMGAKALFDREKNQVLAWHDGQVGGTTSLVQLWDLKNPVDPDKEMTIDKQRLVKWLRDMSWSPDRKQVTTIRRTFNNVSGLAAIRAKLTNTPIPTESIWLLESHNVETGKMLYAKDIGATFSHQFDPSGKYLFTRHPNKIGRLWHAATGEAVSEPQKHEYENIWRVAFTPDGSKMITITSTPNTSIHIWDLETGVLDFNITSVKDSLQRLTSGPKGKWVTVATNTHVLLLNLKTGQLLETRLKLAGKAYEGEIFIPSTLSFSPDGTRLLAQRGKFVQVWETASWKPVFETMEHVEHVNHATFDTEGGRLLTCSDDGRVRIWNAKTGQLANAPLNHEGPVTWADFDADGRRIVSFSSFNGRRIRRATLRSWDLTTAIPTSRTLRHQRSIRNTRFHPDGKTVLTAGSDGRVLLWNIKSGEPRLTIQIDKLSGAYFVGSGKAVLTITRTTPNTIQLWDSNNGEPLSPAMTQNIKMKTFDVNSDLTRLLVVGEERQMHVWDIQEGTLFAERPSGLGKTVGAWFVNDGEQILSINSHDFPSPNATAVLTETENGKSRVLQTTDALQKNSTVTRLVTNRAHNLYATVVNTPGENLEQRLHSSVLFIYKLDTGEAVTEFQLKGVVRQVLFSPDGQKIAASCDDGRLFIWDVKTRRQAFTPLQLSGQINSIAFSPDSRLLVTANAIDQSKNVENFIQQGGTVQVWDCNSGHPVTPPLLDTWGQMAYARFSPDGNTLLTHRSNAPAVQLYSLIPPENITANQVLSVAEALTQKSTFEQPGTDEEKTPGWDEISDSWPELTSPSQRDIAQWHMAQVKQARLRDDWAAAVEHMEPVVEVEDDWESYKIRAWYNILKGQFDDAAEDYQAAIERDMPLVTYQWYIASGVALIQEKPDQYRSICQLAAERLLNSKQQIDDSYEVARACYLIPGALDSYEILLEKTSLAASRDREDSPAAIGLFSHGAILYRAGEYEQAKHFLERSIVANRRVVNYRKTKEYGEAELEAILAKGTPAQWQATRNWLFLAMSEHQLENADRARLIYDHIKKYRKRLDNLHYSWVMELKEMDRYIEEAEALLGVEAAKPDEDESGK